MSRSDRLRELGELGRLVNSISKWARSEEKKVPSSFFNQVEEVRNHCVEVPHPCTMSSDGKRVEVSIYERASVEGTAALLQPKSTMDPQRPETRRKVNRWWRVQTGNRCHDSIMYYCDHLI
ncbi:uncharacterized protein G2W53_018439 [Senna tora]|uniref:Uncharacterized protein n=1 Tax=Senna tora TaxID=362788 RepID=A0A834TVY0_9FABA|nr:uncharacterized protein G2W53_018439 [Senna tora]